MGKSFCTTETPFIQCSCCFTSANSVGFLTTADDIASALDSFIVAVVDTTSSDCDEKAAKAADAATDVRDSSAFEDVCDGTSSSLTVAVTQKPVVLAGCASDELQQRAGLHSEYFAKNWSAENKDKS